MERRDCWLAVAPYDPETGAVVEYEDVVLVIPQEVLPEGIAEIQITEVTSGAFRGEGNLPHRRADLRIYGD